MNSSSQGGLKLQTAGTDCLSLSSGGNYVQAHLPFIGTSGGFTDTVSVSHPSSTSIFRVNAVAGQIGGYQFGVAGQTRAALYCDANNVSFSSWNSSGVWIDQPLVIPNSAGGTILMYRPLTSTGQIIGSSIKSQTGSAYNLLVNNQPTGAYNPAVQEGDNVLVFTNGTSGQGSLTIGAWNGTGGVRINSAGVITAPSFNGSLAWKGIYTAAAPGTTRGTDGLNFYGCYSGDGYPTSYGNVLHMRGGGANQLLLGWSGSDGSHADNYIRSKRDNDTGAWSPWAKIITDVNIGSTGAAIGGTQFEATNNGTAGGIIMRNPSGTRFRLSINASNQLQLDPI